MIEKLSIPQTKIIVALAKYKYLTSSQMISLGIATKRTNITTFLSKLKAWHKPYIETISFGFQPGAGKVENIICLTKRAKKALIEEMDMPEESIKIPIGATMFSTGYFHRKYTIDCHIAFELTAEKYGYKMNFFDRYFDKIGSNRKGGTSRAKTKIDIDKGHYLIADGIFMLQTTEQKELYCLEVYCGKDTGRTHKQLRQYIEALRLGSPSLKYNFERANRVLCVFEYESIMMSVMERLKEDLDFTHLKDFFLFKTLESMKEPDVFEGWKLFDNQMVSMFYKRQNGN